MTLENPPTSGNLSIEDFLRTFHKTHPGCTPAAFANGATEDLKTSYDIVASVLPNNKQVTVLDLACGDGALLDQILNSGLKEQNLIGVDMSPDELKAARKRLGSSAIRLLEGRAQQLPLANESVDFVLCHMAFMLMNDVEQVINEIHRVLKPGGTFSAVVGGKYQESPTMKLFLTLLDEALHEEGVSWLKNLGDQRTRGEDGLRSLFAGNRFVQPGVINDFAIQFKDRPENLLSFFLLMYDVAQLSSDRQMIFADTLLSKFQDLVNAEGTMSHAMGLRHFIFIKT